MESLLAVRYPPYTAKKAKQYKQMSELKPNFDRNGNARSNWLLTIFGLGAKGKSAGLVRWLVVLAGK